MYTQLNSIAIKQKLVGNDQLKLVINSNYYQVQTYGSHSFTMLNYIFALLDLLRLRTTQKILQQTSNSSTIVAPPATHAIMIIIIIPSSLLPV